MKRLAAQLRYRVGQLDWPALVGIGLIAFALALQLGGTRESEARLADLLAEVQDLRNRAGAMEVVGDPATRQLQVMDEFLPKRDALPALVESLQRAAVEQGLALKVVDYKEGRERDTDLLRYQVTLPLSGTYPQIRAWLGQVLNALPAAALDELSLKRDAANNAGLEGRVRLTLYFREA